MIKMKLGKKIYWIAAAISVLYLFLAVWSASSNYVFADEPFHLSAGYTKLKLGDYRMQTEAPPLMNIISASPLLFADLNTYENSPYWINKDMIKYSHNFIYKNNISAEQIVFLGRLPSILLGLLLGIFIFFFIAKNYDSITACIVYLLYATHPMILTHSSVAYIDFGFMFFNFFTFMSLLAFIYKKEEKYLYLFFVLFSLAFLTKFTSIHNFIFYPLILVLNYKKLKDWFRQNKKNIVKYLLIFAAVFYASILVFYGFQNMFVSLSDGLQNDPHIGKEDRKYTEAAAFINKNQFTKTISNIPLPLPYYFVKGAGFWFFDTRSTDNEFKLFESLKGILLKNTMTVIALLLFYIYMLFREQRKITFSKEKPFNYDLNFLYYIIYYFAVFSIIGSFFYPRYLLMIYPFIIILAAKPISMLINSKIKKQYKILLFAVLILAHIICVVSFAPEFYNFSNGLRYLLGNPLMDLPAFLTTFGFA